jgi:hypothetical protein
VRRSDEVALAARSEGELALVAFKETAYSALERKTKEVVSATHAAAEAGGVLRTSTQSASNLLPLLLRTSI